jgi:hypothetical protein
MSRVVRSAGFADFDMSDSRPNEFDNAFQDRGLSLQSGDVAGKRLVLRCAVAGV